MPDDLTTPENRTEDFLAAIAGLADTMPSASFTRLERYLKAIGTAIDGKAPGDYGLGGIDGSSVPKVPSRATLDTTTRNGWYIYQSTEDIATTVPYKYGAMLVIAYTQNRTMQLMYLYGGSLHNLTIVTRYQDGAGNWNAWEYLNPPMSLNAEYPTTERFLGKTVYAKVISFTGPTANSRVLSAIGATNIDQILSVSFTTGSDVIPVVNNDGTLRQVGSSDKTNVYLWSSTDISTTTVYATVKYTKTSAAKDGEDEPSEKDERGEIHDEVLEELRT